MKCELGKDVNKNQIVTWIWKFKAHNQANWIDISDSNKTFKIEKSSNDTAFSWISLKILSINSENEGDYKCEASTLNGIHDVHFPLEVLSNFENNSNNFHFAI